jgi:ubiquinone/menaquinone biosynthesis C-methylase UbiE
MGTLEMKARERSRRAFDAQASVFDREHWGEHARALYDPVLAVLGGISFDSILDVGCGTGALLEKVLARRRPPSVVRGLDLSPEMLAVARERLGDGVHLVEGDAAVLPFDEASVDVVTCVDSFHHYPVPDAVLLEMRRVLRPLGYLVLADFWLRWPLRQSMNLLLRFLPYGDVRVYSRTELVVMTARAGLQEVRWTSTPRRGQLLVCRAL